MAAIHRALSAGEEVTEEVWRERIIRLSERERAVLALILENLPTHAVAEQLAIGERTVQGTGGGSIRRWGSIQQIFCSNISGKSGSVLRFCSRDKSEGVIGGCLSGRAVSCHLQGSVLSHLTVRDLFATVRDSRLNVRKGSD